MIIKFCKAQRRRKWTILSSFLLDEIARKQKAMKGLQPEGEATSVQTGAVKP